MDRATITGILGVGNLLMRDEGFGVHFLAYLNAHYRLPERLRLLDGGTAGIMLSNFLEEVDHLYVIDTVNMPDGEPGSIHRFTEADVRSRTISTRMSPHQIGLLEILALCRLRDRAPTTVEMITIVPADLSLGLDLTPTLREKLPDVAALLAESLARQGIFLLSEIETVGINN